MITVIIKDDGEPRVVELTYSNLWRELKDIPDSQLIVAKNWLEALPDVKNRYVCFVEADCLVSSGYFTSQLGLYKKSPFMRKLAVMGSSTAINHWHNRIYGYSLGNSFSDGVVPIREKKSRTPYPVQVAYIPGALVHTEMLKQLLETIKPHPTWQDDLQFFSTQLSLGFWRQGVGNGVGNRVHLNPSATYVTTEEYVNNLGNFDTGCEDLVEMFKKQVIS